MGKVGMEGSFQVGDAGALSHCQAPTIAILHRTYNLDFTIDISDKQVSILLIYNDKDISLFRLVNCILKTAITLAYQLSY